MICKQIIYMVGSIVGFQRVGKTVNSGTKREDEFDVVLVEFEQR